MGLNAQHTYVHGKVMDADGKELSLAYVKMVGSVISDMSDDAGYYELKMPTGEVSISVTKPGYAAYDTTFQLDIAVTEMEMDIVLKVETELSSRLLFNRKINNQREALLEQAYSPIPSTSLHADLFNQYPDISLSTTTQRIPFAFNKIAIDGQMLPQIRNEDDQIHALDLIPFAIVEAVQLKKGRTADMDADAVEIVDFKLRQPQQKIEAVFQGGLGYNAQHSSLSQIGSGRTEFGGIINSELSDEKIYLMVAGSYTRSEQNIYNRQIAYFRPLENQATKVFRNNPSEIDLEQQKISLSGAIELRPSAYNRIKLSYNISQNSSESIERSAAFLPESGRQGNETINWKEKDNSNLLMIEVENHFNRLKMDYSISVARNNNLVPERIGYHAEGFYSPAPVTTPSFEITTNLLNRPVPLSQIYVEKLELSESIAIGEANITYFTDEKRTSYFKSGIRYRIKDRIHGFASDIKFPSSPIYIDANNYNYQGLYSHSPDFAVFGVDTDDVLAQQLLREDADSKHQESIFSGYLMRYKQWTPRISNSIGLRMESTTLISEQLDDVNDLNYNRFFPSLNLAYKVSKKQQIRLAFFGAMERPGYTYFGDDTQPQHLSDNRVRLASNTFIQPSSSQNLQLVYEHYGTNDNVFAVTANANLIKNPLVSTVQFQNFTRFSYFQNRGFVNKSNGKSLGLGISFSQDFSFVHPALKDMRLNANYQYNQSSVKDSETDIPLSGVPQQQAMFNLMYQPKNQRIAATITGNFSGKTLLYLSNNSPVYQLNTFNLDASIDCIIFKNTSIYTRLHNLTDAVIKHHIEENDEHKLFSSQQYGSWGTVGLRWQM